GRHQLVVERRLSTVFHGELDHVGLRPEPGQPEGVLVAGRSIEPGHRVRGRLLLRAEFRGARRSRKAPRAVAVIERRPDDPGWGGRTHRDGRGGLGLRVSGPRRPGRVPHARQGRPDGPGRHDRQSVPGPFLERASEPLGHSGQLADRSGEHPGGCASATMKIPGGGLFSRLVPRRGDRVSMGRWGRSQARFLSFFLPAAIFLIVLVIYPTVATLTLRFVAPDGSYACL